jgi:hypothetical protein
MSIVKLDGLEFSIIICLNLREFEQMIVKDHLEDLLDRINGWTTKFLFA